MIDTTLAVNRPQTDWILSGQISDQEPVRKFRVHQSPFRIGRARDLDLTINCPAVSGQHAELIDDVGHLKVVDLGSTNGTYVNGNRINGSCNLTIGDLVQFAGVVFRVGRETPKVATQTIQSNASDGALAIVQFDRLMSDRAAIPYYQPIIETNSLQPIGYEVLGRSKLFGLQNPKEMFTAASLLNQEADLSRLFRREGMSHAAAFTDSPNIFLNTHPKELAEIDVLTASLRELRSCFPEGKITLEIHEATITNPEQMQTVRDVLSELHFELAYDDYGAGQARLIELVEVPPDYLKFDLRLIQGIQHASAKRQQMLESLVKMVVDLGIVALAEGIECQEEHDICTQVGFKLAQGFFYGRPAPISKYVDS